MGSAVQTVDLGVAVPDLLASDFLSKLYYLSDALESFDFAGEKREQVRFVLRAGREADSPVVAERIALTARKICQAFRGFTPKVLVNRMERPTAFAQDPHPLLEAAGALKQVGQGRYALGPLLMGLTAHFDRVFLRLADRFQAPAYQFPSLIGAETLERCRYLKSFPHSLNLVSHLKEDLAAIQGFASAARWSGDHLELDPQSIAGVKCLLSPSVCFHWYAWLQDQVLPAPRTITAIGKCFRYESGNLGGLERLWDFTMRELIFTGPRDYVLAQRQRSIDATVELMDAWGLAYEIKSATDPFFIEDYSSHSSFQLAFDLKFEVRALLPYKQSTLAVGSFNHHQDFFGKYFNIKSPGGALIDTGCIGFGLERLALAFLAQHGLEPGGWPEAVRAEVAA